MRRVLAAILTLACITAWGEARAASKTFDVSTGLIDGYGKGNTPDSVIDVGIGTALSLNINTPTGIWFADYSINDSAATWGTITADSAFFIYTFQGTAGDAGDTMLVRLKAITWSQIFDETQATYNSRLTGTAWDTVGAGTAGVISDTTYWFSTMSNTRDTLIIRRTGSTAGAAWLDTAKVGSAGIKFDLTVKAGHNYHNWGINSTENTTAAYRPVIVYFYTVAGTPASASARRRILSLDTKDSVNLAYDCYSGLGVTR